MNRKQILILVLLALGVWACSKQMDGGGEQAPLLSFQQPPHFPPPTYRLAANPVTEAGFELGRTVFYDRILSADQSISCGDCHIQTSAFTHHGHTVSHGILDRLGTRNATPIMNLAWNTSFMWDGGVADLDLQPIVPITSHVEMDETLPNVLQKLRNTPRYRQLFLRAYGSEEITATRFLKALSQFMVMCVSSGSRYDSVVQGLGGARLSVAEEKGRLLVQQKCGSCHAGILFTDHSFRNNGLKPSLVNDEGRFLVTQQQGDRYKFRVPSLRNLAYTAPYMHDGRFLTLNAVLDHYQSGLEPSATLDPLLPTPGIPLTEDQKTQILSFLNTLNDRRFLFDRRFSEP